MPEMMSERERFEQGVIPRDLSEEMLRDLFEAAVAAQKLAESLPDIWD